MTRSDDGLSWVHETLDHPPAEPPSLIDGFMRAGELVVVAGPRAVGKSHWAFNLAGCLAFDDMDFLGCLPVRRQARVLFLQGEMDPWAAAQRWRMLLGPERPTTIAETFLPVRLRVVQVNHVRATKSGRRSESWHEGILDERVEGWIAEHGFDVLIVDPWASYYQGNENSNDETEAALGQLRALALKYGTAIVVVHHFAKANDVRDPEDLWRGASRLADWASTRVTMLAHYSATAAADAGLTPQDARRFVDLHFLRRHEPLDDFSVHLDETGLFSIWHPDETETPARFIGHLTPSDVARVCVEHGGFPSLSAAARALGVSGDRARQALDRAVAAGLIAEVSGNGNGRAFRVAAMAEAFGADVVPLRGTR